MVPLFELDRDRITPLTDTSFNEQGFSERGDLQRLLRNQIGVIAPETKVIAEEFCDWEDSRRRVDLLAIDLDANLVVIELKRTEDGGHMELQALRYAAMLSTMTFDQVVAAHAHYLETIGNAQADARQSIIDFLVDGGSEPGILGGKVRLVLVSAEFSREVTTTVLWLNDQGLDIRCIRMRPYISGEKLLLNVEQIIPLPEAAAYRVGVAERERQRSATSAAQRDFTRFDVKAEGKSYSNLPKRTMMLIVLSHLLNRGVQPETISRVISSRGNRLFRIAEGELDESAFLEQLTETRAREGHSFDPVRWFCTDDQLVRTRGRTIAISNQWGDGTAECVDAILAAFPEHGLSVSPSRKE